MNKTYQRDKGINISLFGLLNNVFDELNWSKEDELLDKFSKMMEHLNNEEQLLILNLTRDFLLFSDTQYLGAINKLVAKVDAEIPTIVRNVLAVPLIKPDDIGKVKSGASTIYLLRDSLKELARKRKIKIELSDRAEFLNDRKDRANTLILFVDDFVGSGRTAITAINEYKKKLSVPTDNVFVIALAAQEKAMASLASIGITCICAYPRTRGISDSARFLDKNTALTLMDQIETRLNISPDYRRGLSQSEALVCMLMRKCPNNTFPVFWTDKKVNGIKWSAPFYRSR